MSEPAGGGGGTVAAGRQQISSQISNLFHKGEYLVLINYLRDYLRSLEPDEDSY